MKSETSSDIPTRRTSVTESVNGEGFSFSVTVGFHPTYGSPLEVFLTQRGKSGSPLELTLYEIGVAASKMMQDYDTSGHQIKALEEALTQQREENVRLGRLLQGKNVREEME